MVMVGRPFILTLLPLTMPGRTAAISMVRHRLPDLNLG